MDACTIRRLSTVRACVQDSHVLLAISVEDSMRAASTRADVLAATEAASAASRASPFLRLKGSITQERRVKENR